MARRYQARHQVPAPVRLALLSTTGNAPSGPRPSGLSLSPSFPTLELESLS
jgi:hypothetical protein